MHTHPPTCMHARTHACTHACMQAHPHTHTCRGLPQLLQFVTLMSLFMAVDWAALTNPSISAPLKFLVCAASSIRSTSGASFLCARIVSVWMFRIWSRPCWSGRPVIKTTSQPQNKLSTLSLSGSSESKSAVLVWETCHQNKSTSK